MRRTRPALWIALAIARARMPPWFIDENIGVQGF